MRWLPFVFAIISLPGLVQAQVGSPPDGGGHEQWDAGEVESGTLDATHVDAETEPALLPANTMPAVGPSSASDVIVSAGRPLSKDRAQDSKTIEGESLRDSPRATLFEAISQTTADVYVPGHGVGLHGVGNGATGGIKIRGLGGSPNSQVLVVEDGVPDYQGIFGHPVPDAYVPHLLEDVLIVKGGDSTLYGTNAMGGVVVMRSRWREQEGGELWSDSSYGSYSTLRESLSAVGRSGDWDGAVAFTGMKTDGHRAGAGGNTTVGAASVRTQLARGLRLVIRNKVAHVEGNDPGPVTHPTLDHGFDVWRDSASMQIDYSRSPWRLSLVPYLNAGVHRLYDGFYSHDYVAGAVSEAEVRPHRMVTLLLGLAGEGVGGSVENRITGEHPHVRVLADVSLYDQLTLKPLPSLSIVLGTRGLASSEYGFVPLYKAGFRWDIGGGVFVHGRMSRNFRQPTIRELYLPYPTANPDLKPEYALNSDVGVGFLSAHFEIGGSAYRTEARDLIKYFGVWPAAEVVNIDHLVIVGVEGHVALRHLGPMAASVSGDWQDVGRYTRQNPDGRITFTLEGAQDLGAHFLAASLTGEWVHGLFMADYGRQPIPDVFVMDLAVRYRRSDVCGQQGPTLEPYVLLRNLLDRQYAYVEGYVMPGFNVMAGLKTRI